MILKMCFQDQAARLAEVQQLVVGRHKSMQEMRTNRHILVPNWEMAESQVRWLDEIFYNTMMFLASVPDLSQQYPGLSQPVTNLQLVRQTKLTQEVVSTANKETNSVMSRSLDNKLLSNPNGGGITSIMYESQILTTVNASGIFIQSILSDPCLLESSAPSLPSHLECKYVSRDNKYMDMKYQVYYECVVLVKKVWHKQELETLPDLTVQMVEDFTSRLQSSVFVKFLDSCGDVEKNPGPGR